MWEPASEDPKAGASFETRPCFIFIALGEPPSPGDFLVNLEAVAGAINDNDPIFFVNFRRRWLNEPLFGVKALDLGTLLQHILRV
jgi:hypothetical protein